MTTQKQHVDMHRKLMLRRNLMRGINIENIYVPFIGDGDIAAELYADMNVYGADLDPTRVTTASARLPRADIRVADCNRYAFADIPHEIQAADLDAYVEPYLPFRSFWTSCRRADRMVIFFTDGHRQGLKRSGTFYMPDGSVADVSDISERRKAYNFYFSKYILPWFTEYVNKDGYKVRKRMFYLRKDMLYWGAVIER